jgi:hypothetical protein
LIQVYNFVKARDKLHLSPNPENGIRISKPPQVLILNEKSIALDVMAGLHQLVFIVELVSCGAKKTIEGLAAWATKAASFRHGF